MENGNILVSRADQMKMSKKKTQLTFVAGAVIDAPLVDCVARGANRNKF